jgi:hypothetical protein
MLKRLLILILCLAILIGMGLLTTAARADDGKLFGQVRWRWEGWQNQDFDSDVKDSWGTNYLRSRFGYKTTVGERGFFKVSVENVREMGQGGLDPPSSPYAKGLFDNGDNSAIYLHTAFLGYKDFLLKNFNAAVGRFSLAYGRERVIGREDWLMRKENRFDGFKGRYKMETSWLDLLGLWLSETGPTKYGDGIGDINLRGAYFHYEPNDLFHFEPYIFWTTEAHVKPENVHREWDNDSVWTFGALIDYWGDSGIHLYLEGLFNSGSLYDAPTATTDQVKVKLSTSGFYGGLFYTFASRVEPFLGFEYNYASGKDPHDTDSKIKTFTSPFGSTADYLGRMNVEAWSNTSSFRFAGGLTAGNDLDMRVDFFIFRAVEEITTSRVDETMLTSPTKSLGSEIDIILNYYIEENITFEGGLGIFNGGVAYKFDDPGNPGDSKDPDAKLLGWLGAQVTF